MAPSRPTKFSSAWFLRFWSLGNSVCNPDGEGSGECTEEPEEIKVGHMSFGELSNTSNTKLHMDTQALFKLWMYVGE